MNIKKYIMNVSISIIVIITFLFSQNLDLFTQKITLENSLRDKIYSELERVLNKNKNRFVVVVNLELGRYGDLISENPSNSNYNARGMEYLPGVPLSTSKGTNKNNQSSKMRIGANDYIISEIDIAVYIEQSLATGSNEKMIESLIKGIIPQTSQCDDCVTIETMNFQAQTTEDTEIDKLRKELEAYKENDRQREMTELNLQLADLKARLEDSENDRMTWEDYQRRQDSLKLAQFQQIKAEEDALIKEQLKIAQDKLDTAINQRIESETSTKNKVIDILGGNSNDPFSVQGKSGSTMGFGKILLYFGLILLVLVIIAFLFILINKKSVVYLKPKGSDSNSDNSNNNSGSTDKAKSDSSNNEQSTANNNNVSATTSPMTSSANADESVVSSELKALRQSSISMSASQKEGATQIIKDWMDDGLPQDGATDSTESSEGGE